MDKSFTLRLDKNLLDLLAEDANLAGNSSLASIVRKIVSDHYLASGRLSSVSRNIVSHNASSSDPRPFAKPSREHSEPTKSTRVPAE